MNGRSKFAFLLFFFVWIFLIAESNAQESVAGYYWVAFTDKVGTPYSLDRPEEFLSQRAIDRRTIQQIPIEETDLPVSPVYLDSLRSIGFELIHWSKWLNGVTLIVNDSTELNLLEELDFINNLELTKPLEALKFARHKFENVYDTMAIDTSFYGNAVFQVGQLNGQYLHNQGYKGSGIQIAVLDAGFYKVNEFSAFNGIWDEGRILGTRDFVHPFTDIFSEHWHGENVLSTMGISIPGVIVGTAPEASYYLFRSEDDHSEYMIEEDNWVVAAEFADSLGADIINSSLGYFVFDDARMDHTYAEMDGNTTRVTKAANIAFVKGMLVFASAGNERNDSWKYIIAPSDGENVISVGAVNKDAVIAPFSSAGPAYGGGQKPNVVALGWNAAVINSNGEIATSNGTSFSSPILAGMSACLWQANPSATAIEMKEAIEQSASQYETPDSLHGYGVPDFAIAYHILKSTKKSIWEDGSSWRAFPNPFNSYIILESNETVETLTIQIFDLNGKLLRDTKFQSKQLLIVRNLEEIPNGLIIFRLITEKGTEELKLVKISQ